MLKTDQRLQALNKNNILVTAHYFDTDHIISHFQRLRRNSFATTILLVCVSKSNV